MTSAHYTREWITEHFGRHAISALACVDATGALFGDVVIESDRPLAGLSGVEVDQSTLIGLDDGPRDLMTGQRRTFPAHMYRVGGYVDAEHAADYVRNINDVVSVSVDPGLDSGVIHVPDVDRTTTEQTIADLWAGRELSPVDVLDYYFDGVEEYADALFTAVRKYVRATATYTYPKGRV